MEIKGSKFVVIYVVRNDFRVYDNECLYWV